jgi:endonuclease/exonuclease/phosphatase family metal-dependent hydrolase
MKILRLMLSQRHKDHAGKISSPLSRRPAGSSSERWRGNDFMINIYRPICIAIIFFIITPFAFASTSRHFSVMTFNIENGGTQVDFNKIVEAVKKSGADIVGIQEAWGNTRRLAAALGWKYYDPSQHIVSRFPLFERMDSKGTYVFVEVTHAEFVAMANMHLPDEPYGPDLIHKGIAVSAVVTNEQKVRLPTALTYIDAMSSLAKKGIPVFLTGDFNSPSHLDWTTSTVNVLRNHRYAVTWPVTKIAAAKGLTDSYRNIYPNPTKDPGYTWPAERPIVKKTIDNFNPSAEDLPDRIDFIFTAGHSRVLNSHVLNSTDVSPWPSDHRAVVSQFEVQPISYPIKKLTSISNHIKHTDSPTISVSHHSLHIGEALIIQWRNAPGNRYDYVRITPTNSNQHALENASRVYTRGEINGSVKYNAKNAKGNSLAWFKSNEAHWPLMPGTYDIKLMLDDSYTSLASTKVIIN